jgi:hypothetical protein
MFVTSLLGQTQNTVYQQLRSNYGATGATANVTNIGQTGHTAFIRLSNAPAQSCGSPAWNGELEFSYDNSLWIGFGAPLTAQTTNSITSQIYYGGGAFPFVRFNILAMDTVHCRVDVYYTGSLPSTLVQVQGSIVQGGDATNVNPILIGGLGSTGAVVNGFVPLVACNNALQSSSVTGATLIGSLIVTGGFYNFCSLVVTMTANGTFKLFIGTDNTCTVSLVDLTPTFTLNAGVPLTLGGGLGAVIKTQGTRICGITTGGTAAVYATYASTSQ